MSAPKHNVVPKGSGIHQDEDTFDSVRHKSLSFWKNIYVLFVLGQFKLIRTNTQFIQIYSNVTHKI